MRIDHIAIWTDDLEKEKNFFMKYFECSVNEKYFNPKKQFSSYFITFEGGARIELINRPDIKTERREEAVGLAHFAVDTGSREKVEKITAILENDGYRVFSRPRITGDGYYESVVLDPEGNIIELMSKLI
jgi:lactoylglutathione lyase